MNRKNNILVFAGVLALLCGSAVAAQESSPSGTTAPQQRQGQNWGDQEGGQRPLFGKITALKNGALEITRQDGQVIAVKFTDQTEFRKDREKAKAADFKVGDMVMVRGDDCRSQCNGQNNWNTLRRARRRSGRNANGYAGKKLCCRRGEGD